MRAIYLAPLLVAAIGCVGNRDVCGGVSGTCVALHVSGPAGLNVDQLALSGSGAFTTAQKRTPSTPKQEALPIDVGLTFPAGDSGGETLAAVAFYKGAQVATGSTQLTLVGGKHQPANLTLVAGPGGGGLADGGLSDGGPLPDLFGTPGITIGAPSSTVYTNGSVSVQLVLTGPVPDVVELLRDGALLANLATGTLQFTWDTTSEAEGMHQLMARAVYQGVNYDSDARTVWVDRTPPTVTTRTPLPTSTNVEMLAAVTAQFSEPMLPSTINDGSLVVSAGSVQLAKTLSLSSDGATLTITPAWSSATLPATAEVMLSTQMTDRAGNPLVLPTSDWTWSIPFWQTLGSAPMGASERTLRLLSNPQTQQLSMIGLLFQGTAYELGVCQSVVGSNTWNALTGGDVRAGGPHFGGSALAADGTLTLGFVTNGPNLPFEVETWDATANTWQVELSIPNHFQPDVFELVKGVPTMAFIDTSAYTATFQEYVNGAWAPIGTPVALGSAPDTFSILRADGTGVATFAAYVGSNIRLYRFDGTNFTQVGGTTLCSVGAADVGLFSLEYGPDTVGALGFSSASEGNCYLDIDGTTVAEDDLVQGSGLSVAVSRSDERLAVSLVSGAVHVWRRHNTSDPSWHDLGQTVNTTTTGTAPLALTVDVSNRPIVTYTDSSVSSVALVARGNMPLP